MRRGLTESDNVANETDGAEVELALTDLLAASGETDGNGGGVRGSQAHDTNTREGVEGGSGAEVDEAEEKLDDHAEHHSVQGHIELVVDHHPPLGAGNGTVTGKSPGAAGGGGCAGDTAKDGKDDERSQKTDGTAAGAGGHLEDVGHGLGKADELDNLGHDKNNGDEEEETAGRVHEQSGDHGTGHLDRRTLDLFAHAVGYQLASCVTRRSSIGVDNVRNDHAGGRGGVAGVEQADTERPSIRPARVVLEVSEDPFGITAAAFGHNEDRDNHGNNTNQSPEDGGSLDMLELAHVISQACSAQFD